MTRADNVLKSDNAYISQLSGRDSEVLMMASTTLLIRLETLEWVYEEHDLN